MYVAKTEHGQAATSVMASIRQDMAKILKPEFVPLNEAEAAFFRRTYKRFVVKKVPPGYNTEVSQCVYAGDGVRCAIGMEFPADEAQRIEEQSGGSIASQIMQAHTFVEERLAGIRPFIADLIQQIHDDAAGNPRVTELMEPDTEKGFGWKHTEASLDQFRKRFDADAQKFAAWSEVSLEGVEAEPLPEEQEAGNEG